MWTFSIILESVCVLPQLLLLRQTTVPTVIDSFYLLTLGSYRAFYILNWIWGSIRGVKPEPIAVTFGIVQTALYLDFAWVYWTRQRVKLRSGGVVDSDDLSRGWLVGKLLGRGNTDVDDEAGASVDNADEAQVARPVGSRGGWGARGISVSADEGVLEQHQQSSQTRNRAQESDSVTRPEETTGILAHNSDDDDDDDEDYDGVLPPNSGLGGTQTQAGVGSGEEWRSESK